MNTTRPQLDAYLSALPKCEVQNLQGCKIFDGHCHLDCDLKSIIIYPLTALNGKPDAEVFISIDGDRLRLHGVAPTEDGAPGFIGKIKEPEDSEKGQE